MCGDGICSSDVRAKMQMQMQHEFAIKTAEQTFTRGHTNKIGPRKRGMCIINIYYDICILFYPQYMNDNVHV